MRMSGVLKALDTSAKERGKKPAGGRESYSVCSRQAVALSLTKLDVNDCLVHKIVSARKTLGDVLDNTPMTYINYFKTLINGNLVPRVSLLCLHRR